MSLRALIPFGLMVGISSYATLDTVAAQGIDLEVLARQEHALLQETLCPAPGTPALNFAELFDPQRQRMEPALGFRQSLCPGDENRRRLGTSDIGRNHSFRIHVRSQC